MFHTDDSYDYTLRTKKYDTQHEAHEVRMLQRILDGAVVGSVTSRFKAQGCWGAACAAPVGRCFRSVP